MTTDIVERLYRLERSYPFTDLAYMLAEAGIEIERLRSGRAAVIEECAKVADSYAVPADRNRGIGPETQALIIRDAIRSLAGTP